MLINFVYYSIIKSRAKGSIVSLLLEGLRFISMLISSILNFRNNNSSKLLFQKKSVVLLNHELYVELVSNLANCWKDELSEVEVILCKSFSMERLLVFMT